MKPDRFIPAGSVTAGMSWQECPDQEAIGLPLPSQMARCWPPRTSVRGIRRS